MLGIVNKNKQTNDVEEEEDDDEALQTSRAEQVSNRRPSCESESDEFQNGVRVFTLIERVYLFTQTRLGIRPMVFKILRF